MTDGHATCDGQKVPQGYYNLEHMTAIVTRRGAQIGVCSSCMDAQGITDEELADGTRRSTMETLTDWTFDADQMPAF